MQIVVPMAGLGQRFVDAGYRLPKPLVPVDGVPMFVRAVEELPRADRSVFVVHPEHVRDHQIDAVIARYFPNSRVVVAPGLTRGQACTVRLACGSSIRTTASWWRRAITRISTMPVGLRSSSAMKRWRA